MAGNTLAVIVLAKGTVLLWAVKAEPVVQKNITLHILLIFSLYCCNV